MLKKIYRLKNRAAFNATYKQRKSVSDDFLIMYLGKEKNDVSVPTKFGFVVSKKYHKRAVKRNRIKRLMREAVRLAIKDKNLFNAEKHLSFIILPKSSCLEASFLQIQNSVLNLLKNIL